MIPLHEPALRVTVRAGLLQLVKVIANATGVPRWRVCEKVRPVADDLDPEDYRSSSR
jgi:hypothetical protein